MDFLDSNVLYIIIYIVFHISSLLVLSLKWDIQSEGIVIGEDVILNCNGTSCPIKRTKKWIGGPDYDVLSFGNASTKPSKYDITGDMLMKYGLKIKNLSFADFNQIYTCACGLKQYSEKLNLDDVNYTYPPHIYKKTIVEDGLKVEMNVYPFPKCFRLFKNKIQSVNYSIAVLSIANHEKQDGSPKLYKVEITQFFRDVKFIDCKGSLDIYCEVGPFNFTIIRHYLDMCKGKIDVPIYVLLAIPVILIVPMCCFCIVSLIKNIKRYPKDIFGRRRSILYMLRYTPQRRRICRCRCSKTDSSDDES